MVSRRGLLQGVAGLVLAGSAELILPERRIYAFPTNPLGLTRAELRGHITVSLAEFEELTLVGRDPRTPWVEVDRDRVEWSQSVNDPVYGIACRPGQRVFIPDHDRPLIWIWDPRLGVVGAREGAIVA